MAKQNNTNCSLLRVNNVLAEDPGSEYGKWTDGGPSSSVWAISPAVGPAVGLVVSGEGRGGKGVLGGTGSVGSVISVAWVESFSSLLGYDEQSSCFWSVFFNWLLTL